MTDPVGLAEIAERLGVKASTAHVWRYRGLLPTPWRELAIGPIWDWPVVAAWARATGRTPEEITHRCPGARSGVMPCCGKTPLEVPAYHRLTLDADLVTCDPGPVDLGASRHDANSDGEM